MKETILNNFKEKIATTAANAVVGMKNQTLQTAIPKMSTSKESIGIIDSLVTLNKTLYVIAYREKFKDDYLEGEFPGGPAKNSSARWYYNCMGDFNKHSPFELLIPVLNVDLSREVLDPRTLIGRRVLVSELRGKALKANLLADVESLNETLLDIPRAFLTSMRNYAGGYSQLDDESNEELYKFVQEKGLQEVVQRLHENSVLDFSGNVIRFENDAVYANDIALKKEGEIILKPIEGFVKHLNQETMKTRKCHLPIKLFSAR